MCETSLLIRTSFLQAIERYIFCGKCNMNYCRWAQSRRVCLTWHAIMHECFAMHLWHRLDSTIGKWCIITAEAHPRSERIGSSRYIMRLSSSPQNTNTKLEQRYIYIKYRYCNKHISRCDWSHQEYRHNPTIQDVTTHCRVIKMMISFCQKDQRPVRDSETFFTSETTSANLILQLQTWDHSQR